MTALASKPAPEKSLLARAVVEEQHLLLVAVGWQNYLAIAAALADRGALRLTYDRGNLEFMTISRLHEYYKKWLNRFIETMAEELNRPIAPGGNMTFQREDLEKALEGDECFWIEHEFQMRHKLTWDPAFDPPPDLFLEIEVSPGVLNRLAIYAALRASEVWNFNGKELRVYRLQEDGNYQLSPRSQIFPEIPLAEVVNFLNRFLNPDDTPDYLTAMQEFRSWLRQILGKPPL